MYCASNVTDIFLQPGEYFVSDAECRMRTLLGSCISIIMWHRARRVGAMSHFLLSSRGADPVSELNTELDARYGTEAMCLMLRELKRLNVSATECQGKIFGGANMFPQQTQAGRSNVGQRNGETARDLLYSHGIPIVSESLFGVGHRQIIFDVKSGHVWARQLELVDADQPYMRKPA